MNVAYRTLFAGILAIVFCGTAVAHDYRHGDWSGGVSVVVTTGGDLSWSGGIGYAPRHAYPVGHVAWSHPYRGAECRHPSHRRHAGHHKRHKHWKKHRVVYVRH